MSFPKIAVADKDCYQLLADGTIKQYMPASQAWRIIDQQENNAQIVGSTPAGLRRETGDVYKFNGRYWEHIGDKATKLWGWKGNLWTSKGGKCKGHYQGPDTGGKWVIQKYRYPPVDFVMVQNDIYQLGQGGWISSYSSISGWTPFRSNTESVAIATDNKSLFTLQRDGRICRLDGQENWQPIESGTDIVQIAGGEAGLFTRHKDGTIHVLVHDSSWQMIDNHTDNVYIAVAASAYRVNTKGEIYQLVSGAWLLLEDKPFDERPTPTDIQPVIYDKHCRNPSPTILRIAGGAAGQSGLIQALSDAFNKFRVSEKFDPCRVAWYKTSPSESLRYLNDGIVDVVITRNSVEVATALNQSIRLSPLGSYLIFREPLLLVGPLSNPANLDPNSDIITMFRTLRQAAQLDYTPRNAGTTDPSASFETRGDGSATHLRECQLWEEVRKVDQPPHLPAFFPYIPINRYPPLTKANIDASLNLYGAANLGYYTLTESSMYRLKPELHTKLTVYKHGQLNDPNDLLVLQGHLLVGARAQYPALAEHFAAWAAGPAGQSIVRDFRICGRSVY